MTVIVTDRLTMRPPVLSDYEDYAAFWASERSRHISGPLPAWGQWLQFSAMCGHWALKGFGWWTLVDRQSNRTAGWLGLFHPPHYADPELGWALAEWAEGQGYATEAAVAAREYGQTKCGMKRIISYVDGANTRSIRLAERLGAVRIETGMFMEKPFYIFMHRLPEGAA
jgi:RimJ/RimL family protein N-acetyltransferase